jgi:hypothetical protein
MVFVKLDLSSNVGKGIDCVLCGSTYGHIFFLTLFWFGEYVIFILIQERCIVDTVCVYLSYLTGDGGYKPVQRKVMSDM